jgi:CheY-like chemotaxis protein
MMKTIPVRWNEASAHPISILIVDDNPMAGEMTAAMTEAFCPARTAIFHSPQKALDAFRAAPETWDCVVTDFHMPGMTGYSLIIHLRALRPELPAVIVSGSVGVNEACQPLTPPVQFLRKPFFMDELRSAMKGMIEEKQPPMGS